MLVNWNIAFKNLFKRIYTLCDCLILSMHVGLPRCGFIFNPERARPLLPDVGGLSTPSDMHVLWITQKFSQSHRLIQVAH